MRRASHGLWEEEGRDTGREGVLKERQGPYELGNGEPLKDSYRHYTFPGPYTGRDQSIPQVESGEPLKKLTVSWAW